MLGMKRLAVWSAGVVAAAALATPVIGQPSCGNAYYDDGTSVGYAWFGGGEAGDPNYILAVKFNLADFGYQPGKTEITGFCVASAYDTGQVYPNEVFLYADKDGKPDDSKVLAQGLILTGTAAGDWIVTFDKPVTLDGDFWLAARGYPPLGTVDFNVEQDAAPDSGHSYYSTTGIDGLMPAQMGDLTLRAYLRTTGRSYLFAGMAHLDGFNGTHWRSKLVVLGLGPGPTQVTITFVQASGSVSKTITVQPNELKSWDDVAVELFGLTGSPSGSVRVDSDIPVVATARTYNATGTGTYGQYYPGVVPADTISKGQAGIISMLTKSSAFRTNIGFINLSDHDCRVRITLHDASGNIVGNPVELTVGASGWKQSNDTFAAAGAGNVTNGYATIEVLDDDCELWGYASVIDAVTGDPTTVPLLVQ
jgi:hypothetical protein